LLRITGTPSLADDLLQETFLRIHRARGTFKAGAAAVPWAYAIARNAWLDHARSASHRDERARRTNNEGESPAHDRPTGPEADAESLAIAQQTAMRVQRALSKLPNTQREAFTLLRYEGMSVEEAAEVLGATPSAVKLRAFRAYEALRQAIASDEERTGSDGT
jgi:RNA polymerase sigma-70 factor (ECF subfamily)